MEIKANELMIGDWVKFPFGNEKIIGLPYIQGRGICASFAASATLFTIEVEKLQPIPLTLEILEKNGMRNGYEPYYVSYLQNARMCHFVYDGDSCSLNVLISNVHELQHALRFCGIDKDIEL